MRDERPFNHSEGAAAVGGRIRVMRGREQLAYWGRGLPLYRRCSIMLIEMLSLVAQWYRPVGASHTDPVVEKELAQMRRYTLEDLMWVT